SVLADSLKIHRDEIVCFGDSPNDVSMFSCAGFPIAMANACDDILARASFVTLDNDSGGVAHGIAHAFGIRDYST
ncbi:MAG: HAD hydrolase family protein, partial [Clostridia bacterium]